RLSLSLSALAALRGRVVISAAAMERPLLRLSRSGSVLNLPASPGGGRMMRAIDAARGIVGENPTKPDIAALPSDAFGTVEFTEGRIVILNGDESDAVTSLSGRVTWPSLNRTARVAATGIWR